MAHTNIEAQKNLKDLTDNLEQFKTFVDVKVAALNGKYNTLLLDCTTINNRIDNVVKEMNLTSQNLVALKNESNAIF